jgi:hypothetical protein
MYFPLRHGRYDVAPGLNRFGKDLGGGSADRHVFQIDRTFGQFRAAKLASRAEQVDRYFHTHALRDDVASDIIVFIAGRLVTEYPDHFYGQRSGDHIELRCRLTGDTVPLNRSPPHLLDAIACQVQEDLAIVSGENARHWLSAAHVCFPNGWAPHEKVGKSFAGFHEPVAGMEEMNRRESHFADIMVNAAEGLVRFAWGVTFDDRLNHHPALPRTPFDPSNPRAFLRVERQTIWGFPQRGAALFTIRTYLYDCDDLRRDPMARDPLISALRSMSPASRTYKGLAEGFDDLVNWLAAGGSGRG